MKRENGTCDLRYFEPSEVKGTLPLVKRQKGYRRIIIENVSHFIQMPLNLEASKNAQKIYHNNRNNKKNVNFSLMV